MAVDPSSSGDLIAAACGIVLGSAPASGGGRSQPMLCAIATSRLAPTRTPSGAYTELHEFTNPSPTLPPHDSPLAFWSLTPSSSA